MRSSRDSAPRRLRTARACAVALAALGLTAVPEALADAPPALPGPPPGGGIDLPGPPGAARGGPAAPTPLTIDPSAAGPGIASGAASLDPASRRVTIALTCEANGRIKLAVPVIARKTIASGTYACRNGSARAGLRLGRRPAGRIARRRSVLAVVTLQERGHAVQLSARLGTGAPKPQPPGGTWSDGVLQCSSNGAPQAYLVAPNWTASPATAVSARAWLAWYRTGLGWHWTGTGGAGSSRWYTWTATPKGVSEWLQPTSVPGAFSLTPWSMGPVTVPLGSDTTVVGVVEAVYWWNGRPTWVWHYVRASADGSTISGDACRY